MAEVLQSANLSKRFEVDFGCGESWEGLGLPVMFRRRYVVSWQRRCPFAPHDSSVTSVCPEKVCTVEYKRWRAGELSSSITEAYSSHSLPLLANPSPMVETEHYNRPSRLQRYNAKHLAKGAACATRWAGAGFRDCSRGTTCPPPHLTR